MSAKSIKKALSCILIAAMVTSVCNTTGVTAAKKAALKTKRLVVEVGSSKKIVIKNKDKKKKYTFKSNKKKIAKVSKSGKVTAVKKGNAKITVKETVKKKKARKLGVVKVTVNAKSDIHAVQNTVTPVNNQPSATPAGTADSTNPPAAATDTPVPGPTMEPAYGTYEFDGFTLNGDYSLPMDNLIKYGAKCDVTFKAENTGSNTDITVKYSGTKASEQGAAFTGEERSVTISSGSSEQKVTLNVDKYMAECSIDFSASSEIKITDVKVETQPFDGADYAKMIDDTFISAGNTDRLKKVIDKARSGQDVTLAYLGGSITEGAGATGVTSNADCYAETSYNEFKKAYGLGDGSNVHFINAGMSGTPSSLGVIRYQNDVLNQMEYGKYPDVLCIEFVVNDYDECTKGEGMESIIREALEQGTAVFLMFAHTVNFDTGKQEYYIPLGEKYNLPMVSVKNGLTEVIDPNNTKTCAASQWFFSGDTLHPNVSGHRYMADAIMNVFYMADKAEMSGNEDIVIDNVDPVYGKSFTGMTMLDSTVNPDDVDAIVSLDAGSFSDVDTAQLSFQYKKGGKDNVQWFPNCWMHSTGTDSFKATVKCSNMMIAYKLTSSQEYGVAELYVDGELKETMNGYQNDGWNNATVRVVFKEDDIAEHQFEIKMADGQENKKFTIYAIGYTNADAYKDSLNK